VGSYAFTLGDLSAGANYTLVLADPAEQFAITSKGLSGFEMAAIADQTFTGSAIEPGVVVSDGTTTLVAGTDYDVAYTNNTNVGTATATITAKGNYTGTLSGDFAITSKGLSGFEMAAIADQTFTGSAIEPGVVVSDGTTTLVAGTDYDVAYTNNTNVGTATATITAKGNYTGTLSGDFAITSKGLSGFEMAAIADQTFTGSAIEPGVVVSDGTTTLVAGTDYDVAYTNNTNVGTATATITAKGNYTGTLSGDFAITSKGLSGFEMAAIADQTFTGSAIEPGVVVSDGTTTLVAGTDYDVAYTNNTNVGTATATITAKGNYTGTLSGDFAITSKGLSGFEMAAIADQTFTGSAIEPGVVVSDGTTTLVAGTDYDVAYTNNTNVGTATATITAKGNYTGTLSGDFAITSKGLSGFEMAAIADQTFTGSAIEPGVVVSDGTTTLVAGTDYDVAYTNNTNVGTATATITAKGNYTGTLSGDFAITSKGLSGFEMAAIADQTFTGSAIEPGVVVSDGTTTLVAGTDYDVAYTNNTNVGTATATITAKGNYTGTLSGDFAITSKGLSGFEMAAIADQTFTGSAIEPGVVVSDGTTTLVAGTDYDVAYTNNTNVGTATATITAKGNYTGTLSGDFAITSKGLSGFEMAAIADQTFTGSAIEPGVVVSDGTTTLVAGTDYDVAYTNNTNVGTATATITAKGNYTGTLSGDFAITSKGLSGFEMAAIADQTFTGSAIEPGVVVSDGTTTLVAGTDYDVAYTNNTNVGTATATITAKGNYTGTLSGDFAITSKGLSGFEMAAIADQTFTGSAIEPGVVVSDGTTTLVAGTDYDVAYTNNTNVGTATATITAKGNYTGTLSGDFAITSKGLSGFEMAAIADQTFTGSAIEPGVVVSDGTTTLVAGTDYDVAYTNNTNVGTATATITAKGNYTGTLSGDFAITSKGLSGFEMAAIADQTFTGSAIEPGVVVSDGTTTLVAGTDYDVAYTNNTNVGTATATITAKGNYTGTLSGDFAITSKGLSGFEMAAIADQTFTGSAIEPGVVVSDGTTTLVAGTDYDVAYTNNTNVGTATATITAKGNYTGTLSGDFAITSKGLSGFEMAAIADQTFTGSAIEPGVVVSDGTTTLVAGTDYDVAYTNNTNVGTATATITAKGNYTGTLSGDFAITSKGLSGFEMAAIADQTFTGSAIEPGVVVSDGTTTLVAGTDYDVAYTNNTNVGTATATITAKGNYTGTLSGDFAITSKGLSGFEMAAIADQTFTGSAIEPGVVVSDGTTTLVAGTDYDVAYTNNTNVGTATATITAKGNYTGTLSGDFAITSKGLSGF
jgi:hypothetical protein